MVLYAIILYVIVINIIEWLRIKCSPGSLVNQAVRSEIMLKIIAWQALMATKKYFTPVGRWGELGGLLDISLQITANCFCQSWVSRVAAAAVRTQASWRRPILGLP